MLTLVSPAILHANSAESIATLRFERGGSEVAALSFAELREACATETLEVNDPYYKRSMRFHAWSLACVIEAGFGEPLAALSDADFSLRALDGYTRPSTSAQLAEPGAFVAYADANLSPLAAEPFLPLFEPITRRKLDPAPFYLIWSGAGQNDPHVYPWPFQLATIERVPFEQRHPHTFPSGSAADSAAVRGYALFRSQCIMCHSINTEGGKVGPDLNVPRSIVEYRPMEQIKAYIRNPQAFRYTTMPAHPQLTDDDLAALVEYFRAMSTLKYEPDSKR